MQETSLSGSTTPIATTSRFINIENQRTPIYAQSPTQPQSPSQTLDCNVKNSNVNVKRRCYDGY